MDKIFNLIISSAAAHTPEDPCALVTDAAQKEALGCNGDASKVMGTANNLVNTAIALIGIVAVIGIIIGGIQYSKSAGDPAKATQAKNTIIYSIVGLIVAGLAFAIVNFVLKAL